MQISGLMLTGKKIFAARHTKTVVVDMPSTPKISRSDSSMVAAIGKGLSDSVGISISLGFAGLRLALHVENRFGGDAIASINVSLANIRS